jgi:hypothetical protein
MGNDSNPLYFRRERMDIMEGEDNQNDQRTKDGKKQKPDNFFHFKPFAPRIRKCLTNGRRSLKKSLFAPQALVLRFCSVAVLQSSSHAVQI